METDKFSQTTTGSSSSSSISSSNSNSNVVTYTQPGPTQTATATATTVQQTTVVSTVRRLMGWAHVIAYGLVPIFAQRVLCLGYLLTFCSSIYRRQASALLSHRNGLDRFGWMRWVHKGSQTNETPLKRDRYIIRATIRSMQPNLAHYSFHCTRVEANRLHRKHGLLHDDLRDHSPGHYDRCVN